MNGYRNIFEMNSEQENTGETSIRVRRGKVDSLSVYEITDYELSQILQGSPNTLYLNLSIFFLSIFSSFFISLLTTSISSDRLYTVFVVVTVVSMIAGSVLGVLWWKARNQLDDLVTKIKARIPSEEVVKQ